MINIPKPQTEAQRKCLEYIEDVLSSAWNIDEIELSIHLLNDVSIQLVDTYDLIVIYWDPDQKRVLTQELVELSG